MQLLENGGLETDPSISAQFALLTLHLEVSVGIEQEASTERLGTLKETSFALFNGLDKRLNND
ncbi:MAG: hypothetical protein WBM99_06800 [Psychromonas sp.]